jgi:hypothetical protein
MKGFAYVDVDGVIGMKTHEYITTENPLFWQDNSHLILRWFPFDTEYLPSMRHMLTQLKNMEMKKHVVLPFLESINFDIGCLKQSADSVQ